MHRIFVQVINPLEALAHANRPSHRCTADVEHLLDFVHQLDRIPALTIELVDKGHDWRGSQPAHIHELLGAGLYALGHIDDHQGGIHCCQGAIGVLGEVLVPRRVQQVHDPVAIRELHDRGGDRDATLLLHCHPVRGGMTRSFAPLHGSSQLNGTAEQQQLFGQRGLAGIWVRDNREGTPARDLVVGLHQVSVAIGARAV